MKTERDGPQQPEGTKVAKKGSTHPTVFEDAGPDQSQLKEELPASDSQPSWGNPRNVDRVAASADEHGGQPAHLSELEKAGHKGVRVGGIAHPGSGERASKNVTVTHGDRKAKPL